MLQKLLPATLIGASVFLMACPLATPGYGASSQTPSASAPDLSQRRNINVSSLRELDDDEPVSTFAGMTAEQLEGADIINPKGEKIGEVDRLLADPNSQPVALIAKSGGFLGIGATAVIVPIGDLKYDAQKHSFIANMSEDQLKAMRKVKRDLRGHLE
jgi:hypothetical protein